MSAQEQTPLLHCKEDDENPGVTTTTSSSCSSSSSSSTDEERRRQQQQRTNHKKLVQGRILLFVVAIIYGSLNVSLRMVYERAGPPTASVLSTTRGWLAVLCFLPLLRFSKKNRNDDDDDNNNNNENVDRTSSSSPRNNNNNNNNNSSSNTKSTILITEENRRYMFWRFALELAVFNFGTQGLQNLSLLTTESARVAFFVQLSVVITPVISACMGHNVHPKVWLACLVAVLGLSVLSNTGVHKNNGFAMKLTTGDLYSLGSAVCWSFYIYRMSEWGEHFDETSTQFHKNIILASMYAVWMFVSMITAEDDASLWEGWKDPISWSLLFYSALGPCTIADIIQQRAQSSVPAAESNVILSLEPVFTAILGLILMGELLSWKEVIGGGLIVAASVLASY
jgi:drug/metabolite transporter (DMT)-like permease